MGEIAFQMAGRGVKGPDAFSTGLELALAACMFVGAALYTSVGHAGASAYIAMMALFGAPSAAMRPTALVLNIVVASFTAWRYIRVGQFRWRTLWPYLIGAMPLALLGGSIKFPGEFYRPLVGVVLLLGAARLLWPTPIRGTERWSDPPVPVAILCGGGIGLLSGLTGTGGGIFLSPLLMFAGWSDLKSASGVAAAFILVISAFGLLGNIASVGALPSDLPVYVGAVMPVHSSGPRWASSFPRT